jgi:CheY-like chemotaxis protein
VTVLLVEDDETHVELIQRSFEAQGHAHAMRRVADGEAALDYLLQRGAHRDPKNSPRPHLIILDLRLPRIDGLSVLRQIRTCEALSTIPVVVLTTSEAERDVAKAYEERANSYLVKPIDFESFSRMIRSLSSYWLEWNHYPWS